jgi:hypothetical protein
MYLDMLYILSFNLNFNVFYLLKNTACVSMNGWESGGRAGPKAAWEMSIEG